jgi:hypothetical protein
VGVAVSTIGVVLEFNRWVGGDKGFARATDADYFNTAYVDAEIRNSPLTAYRLGKTPPSKEN